MVEFDDLYQEVILDHNRNPHHFGEVEDPTHHANGHNPLCGDKLRVTMKLEDGKVADVAFDGSGCAISKASASMMTDAVMGLDRPQAEALFNAFHELVTKGESAEAGPELGKLLAFGGISDYPARVKCASLAWHTLMAALKRDDEPVSTE